MRASKLSRTSKLGRTSKFGHGGARPGAGRKPGPKPNVRHRRRPHFPGDHPLHVTVRVVKKCWNLRSSRSFRRLRQAFEGALGRFGTRLIEYSVQGNHLHCRPLDYAAA